MYNFPARLHQYGPTPQGMGWGSERSQQARFGVLARYIRDTCQWGRYSLIDIGCGYAALPAYLSLFRDHQLCRYVGVDTYEEILTDARRTMSETFPTWAMPEILFRLADPEKNLEDVNDMRADFVFSSGVLQHLPSHVVARTFIENAYCMCHVATIVNGLSICAALEPDLMRFDPAALFGWGMEIAGNAVIDHSYLPHDVTLIMRRK